MKALKSDNELFETADVKLLETFNNTLGNYGFYSFFIILSVLLLVLPLFKLDFTYIKEAVASFDTVYVYFSYVFYWFPIILLLILIFLKAQNTVYSLITGIKSKKASSPQLRLMTKLQICFIMVAGILFVIAPYFNIHEKISSYAEISDKNSVTYIVINIVALIILSINIFCFIVFIIKNRQNVKPLLLPGIRNISLTIPCLLLTLVHKCNYHSGDVIIFTHTIVIGDYTLYEYWSEQYLWLVIVKTLIILISFSLAMNNLPNKNRTFAKF